MFDPCFESKAGTLPWQALQHPKRSVGLVLNVMGIYRRLRFRWVASRVAASQLGLNTAPTIVKTPKTMANGANTSPPKQFGRTCQLGGRMLRLRNQRKTRTSCNNTGQGERWFCVEHFDQPVLFHICDYSPCNGREQASFVSLRRLFATSRPLSNFPYNLPNATEDFLAHFLDTRSAGGFPLADLVGFCGHDSNHRYCLVGSLP